MDRDQAWAIVESYTQSQTLRRHMLAVEAAMRAYAPRFGGDPELWGVVGLLHDFDYEKYPDISTEGHPVVGSKILREQGVSETIIRAILAMCEGLGMDVVAEGIEEEEQARKLQRFGCQAGQGYLFGRPANAEQTLAFVRHSYQIWHSARLA